MRRHRLSAASSIVACGEERSGAGLQTAPAWSVLSGLALLLCLLAPAVRADTVVLENGNRLEGSVEKLPSGEVAIHSALGTLRLPGDLVARVERGPSREEKARATLARLPSEDVESRYRLALELEAAGAATMARRVLEEILRLDPGHAGARHRLGYVRCDGEWVSEERCHELRGEVFYEGRWIEASEWALLRRLEMEREEARLERLRAEARLEAARLEVERRFDYYPPYPYYYPPLLGSGVVVPFLARPPKLPKTSEPPMPPQAGPASPPGAHATPRHLRSGFRTAPAPASAPASRLGFRAGGRPGS